MSQALKDYYAEAVNLICGEFEVEGLKPIQRHQREVLVEAVLNARENESLAFGHDHIPNPLESRLKETEQARAQLAIELNDTERELKEQNERDCRDAYNRGYERGYERGHDEGYKECYYTR